MIPDFTSAGFLPPGIHLATWSEITDRFGTTSHRQALLKLLRLVLLNLKSAGCAAAYLDGSFVTNKASPSDYDMCWSMRDASGAYIDASKLDPVLLNFRNNRDLMKAKYGGDIFPAEWTEGQSGKRFIDFFQVDKSTGQPKGIISIDLRGYV
jgi:hypothetical protein